MILVIDNYDSFTFNLVQYLEELSQDVVVKRNDCISLKQIQDLDPKAIVISPGPGGPRDAGISLDVIRRLGNCIPILGVCLGHQAIGESFGGRVISAGRLMHGKTSPIFFVGGRLFSGMENPFPAGRYHSLIIERETLPDCLEITAVTDQDEIMGIKHKTYPIEGVQFHPESILTPGGKRILQNFLEMVDEFHYSNSALDNRLCPTRGLDSTHKPLNCKSLTQPPAAALPREVPMLKEAIRKTTLREDLTREEMELAMEEIMAGKATPAQIGSLFTALKMKGETVAEITGAATVMRRNAVPVRVENNGKPLLDTCGTGGDGAGTFNISTTVAFIIAAAGVRVAKHGNRSVSSSCGSADVLKELGADLEQSPEAVSRCINKTGFGFLFAPKFHLAMKHAAGPRQEMGIRTMFNLLGPLTNPAGASCQLLGVYDPKLTDVIAYALCGLGISSAMVVHGMDGLDEISLSGPTKISRLSGETVTTTMCDPRELGLHLCSVDRIRGGDSKENARHLMDVLEGKPGPRRDIALLNAAAALVVAGMAEDTTKGLELAAEAVDSGKARCKLTEFLEFRA
ncbi:MAG TPA: bifunctional anthranilate synthase component II/anthranilate phosphoribosyltransferase [Desulfomonilaceae bacterium]|nr:bifunctional anthranilate synthase component II/anthranilate phosphoribosyltransferase [Desulfomonilaceae bacterium]